jgi:type II restriction/modification system DNA methylase subunit YeeA
MNTTAIKNYAIKARRDFRKLVAEKLNSLGINADGSSAPVQVAGDVLVINGMTFPGQIRRQRSQLLEFVGKQGFEQVVEAMAYTLFNRFCALRFMEVHEYLPQRVFSSASGSETPDILANAVDAIEQLGVEAKKAVRLRDMKLRGDQDQELYKQLILAQCNALSEAMPFLFEPPNDMTEALMPENLLHSDSVIRELVATVPEEDWQDIEIVGWLYQFYISEKKDQVIGNVKSKEDIPAATQLFTPEWIVQYMVDNSLGRLWLEVEPNSDLRASMDYYIDTSEANPSYVPPKHEHIKSPEDITVIDPACGSGHILVYAFDLLFRIYEQHGYVARDIPSLILKNNLYGLDIDGRAAQLASFALMMKARSRDRRFLGRGVLPNILEIVESNGIELEHAFDTNGNEASRSPFADPNKLIQDQGLLPVAKRTPSESSRLVSLLQPLVRFFHDAKSYGSLLRVPESLASRLPEVRDQLDSLATGGAGLFDTAAVRMAKELVRQAEVLAGQYDVCVANPPYMGSFYKELKDFAKEEYPDSKADLYSMFIERNFVYSRENGFAAFMTPFTWMFLKSFEKLRGRLVLENTLQSLVRPEYHSFFESAYVPICTFVIEKRATGQKGAFIDLTSFYGADRQAPKALEAIRDRDCGWFHYATASDLRKIPGTPIAYWVSDGVRDLFERSEELGEIAEPRQGLATADNDRFLRYWFEARWLSIGMGMRTAEQAERSGCRWFPYQKGGAYRKWYGNHHFVINWHMDGRELRKFPKSVIRNPSYYFLEGMTWTSLTVSSFNGRYSPSGFVFDSKGPVLFPRKKELLLVIMGFLNSVVANELLKLLAPTMDYNQGPVGRLPVALENVSALDMDEAVGQMISLARGDWDNFETSWDFHGLPLVRDGMRKGALKASWDGWQAHCAVNAARMQELEEENNRIFIEAYGLQDELSPEVPLEQITLTCNPVYRYGPGKAEEEYERRFRQDTMQELVSYAIGCMMGRYSLDKPGLILANQGETVEDYLRKIEPSGSEPRIDTNGHEPGADDSIGVSSRSFVVESSFMPDDDGIIPILEDAYFEDDCTNRLIRFLKVTFDPNTLNENLAFLADALGKKKSETPTDAIRRYLATKFYRDHLRTYKNRPIYWLVSSGKQRAFQVLIYLHRYTPATLSRMRTSYLHELQNKLRSRMDDLQAGIDEASSTAEKNRLTKELATLH